VSARPTLLIVEDEPDLRALMTVALGEEFEVLVAADGAEALAAAQQTPPTLVLLDLRMPGDEVDGFVFVDRYQRAAQDTAAPIIVTSALPLDDQAVLEPHVAAFLPKPFAIAALVTLVNETISRH
jgi:DNA-binding response OmpR family regulator